MRTESSSVPQSKLAACTTILGRVQFIDVSDGRVAPKASTL
jgi:hypothetical protein